MRTTSFGYRGRGAPASSDTISPTDVNDLTRPDENTKTTTSRMIDPVPDGDLVIVLSNLERPSQHGFIRKLLNDLRPTGADELAETDSLPDEVHVRVHENMLKHVGKGFRAMFRSDGTREVLQDGTTKVYRDSEDACEAMLMVLLVVFGEADRVPCTLALEDLVNICVVIDKYLLQKAMKLMIDVWIANKPVSDLRGGSKLTRDLSESVFCIAYIFRDRNMFHIALEDYVNYAKGPLLMVDKPFPETLLVQINNLRSDCVKQLHDEICLLLSNYSKPKKVPLCEENKFACDALAFGSLHMSLRALKTFSTADIFSIDAMHRSGLSTCLGGFSHLVVHTECAAYSSYKARCGHELHGEVHRIVRQLGQSREEGLAEIMKAW